MHGIWKPETTVAIQRGIVDGDGGFTLPIQLRMAQNGDGDVRFYPDGRELDVGFSMSESFFDVQSLDQQITLSTTEGAIDVPVLAALTESDSESNEDPNSGLTRTRPDWSYFIYDHLGSTRVVYDVQFAGECGSLEPEYFAEHLLDYYPYGKILRELNLNRSRYQTTQHERDDATGLDYRGARFYDSDLGQFLSVDPLASDPDNIAWSPYAYVWSNPLSFIDPTGMKGEGVDDHIYLDDEGNEVYRMENDDPDRYFLLPEYCGGGKCGSPVEVNSPRTLSGDNKENNPWNGSMIDIPPKKTYSTLKESIQYMEDNYSNKTVGMIKESGPGGELDYESQFEDGTIYNINGVYYNSHESLNYMWGAAIASYGFDVYSALKGARSYHNYAYLKGKEGYAKAGFQNEKNHDRAIVRSFYDAGWFSSRANNLQPF